MTNHMTVFVSWALACHHCHHCQVVRSVHTCQWPVTPNCI